MTAADDDAGRPGPIPEAPVTEGRLLDGRLIFRQPAAGYRTAIDPVLLAAAVPARPGDRVADLGCGAGAAALCLAARVAGCTVTGLELQPEAAALARQNAAVNGLAGRITVIEGSVTAPPPSGLAPGGFDHVMANPPFLPAGAHTPSPDPAKATAHGEAGVGLAIWIDTAHRLLKPRGWMTMIHRADRIVDLCALLPPRFGAVHLVPLWPKAGQPAGRLVIRARKGVRSPAVVAPGLVLHRPDGRFTAEAEAVLRHGAAL